MPVLSDTELEFGSEVADFVREHIGKICAGDDAKECRFYERESEVCKLLTGYEDENFVAVSQEIAGLLFEIMSGNIDIPPADLMVVRFREGEEEYVALLKMNYKTLYTHRTMPLSEGEGNSNELIRHKSILPSQTQRLTEAAVICLSDLSVQVVEKIQLKRCRQAWVEVAAWQPGLSGSSDRRGHCGHARLSQSC